MFPSVFITIVTRNKQTVTGTAAILLTTLVFYVVFLQMAVRGNVLLSEFVNNLLVSDKKTYLEKIIGVGNHYFIGVARVPVNLVLGI